MRAAPPRRARTALRRAALGLCAVALTLAPAATAAGPEGALDARAWELVSPADKNGGEVSGPALPDPGVLQAAAGGGAFAFGSAASFGEAAGAAPVSQYLSRRGAGGWATHNLTPPLLAGTYAAGAYRLFSSDLGRAILTNGWSCRDGSGTCVAENPPLGSGAPAGYRNLYLREAGKYTPLITTANSPALAVSAEDFRLSLAGATADLRHVVISTCAALTANALEVPSAEGCDPAAQNLYRWSEDGALVAINVLPGESQSAPGATLAAPGGAISANGQRIYWRGADSNLYLREGAKTVQADADAGGGGTFETASTDGAVAFFSKEGHLHRYSLTSAAATDLTPAGGVAGVLGASADGARLYYLSAGGLFLHQGGGAIKVAAGADASNHPPATGTARVTVDGSRLAFLSSASLTGYPNGAHSEVYLYNALAKKLICASCHPKGTPAKGPASIPGALAAGDGPALGKPRALSADGRRLFFDSADSLVSFDTDKAPDVYEWQANGAGGCTKAVGCIGLVSSGRASSATFLDASADGADAFFLTGASLVPADTGALDVYSARSGGGFPAAPPQIPCLGDQCQGPAGAPEDPEPATDQLTGRGNPPLPIAKNPKRRCAKLRGAARKRCLKRLRAKRRGARR